MVLDQVRAGLARTRPAALNPLKPPRGKPQPADRELARLGYPLAPAEAMIDGVSLSPDQFDAMIAAMNEITAPIPGSGPVTGPGSKGAENGPLGGENLGGDSVENDDEDFDDFDPADEDFDAETPEEREAYLRGLIRELDAAPPPRPSRLILNGWLGYKPANRITWRYEAVLHARVHVLPHAGAQAMKEAREAKPGGPFEGYDMEQGGWQIPIRVGQLLLPHGLRPRNILRPPPGRDNTGAMARERPRVQAFNLGKPFP